MLSRRMFLSGAAGLSAAGLLAACGSGSKAPVAASAAQTLTMLNYSGWLGKNTVSGFRKQASNITLKQKDLPSGGSGALMTLIRQNPGSYDFALLGNATAAQCHDAGLLNTFDASKVPNLVNIPEKFRKAYPYGMPLEQGKLGILYRIDQVDSPPTSWKDLFTQLTGSLSGKVLFPDYDIDVISMALLALGHDIHTTSTDEIMAAADLVISVKPDVKAFVGSDQVKSLKNGTATVAVAYDYDTAGVVGVDPTIGWITPSDGTPAYLDGWAIFGESGHQDAVYELMNFILEPANYADFINNTGASYLMPKATSLIDSDITKNKALALDTNLKITYGGYGSDEIRALDTKLWQKIQAS